MHIFEREIDSCMEEMLNKNKRRKRDYDFNFMKIFSFILVFYSLFYSLFIQYI